MLAVLAVAGAVPLTAGVIMWVLGTVLRAGYHGDWGATAGTGEVLIMAGLLCGLCMFVLAANSVRWTPRVPAGRARRVLQPLAAPGQQAWLAGQTRPEEAPQPPAGPAFPAPAPPPARPPAPPPGPPQRSAQGPPWGPLPGPPPGTVAPFLVGPDDPDPRDRRDR